MVYPGAAVRHLKSMWSLRTKPTQKKKEPSNGEVLVSLLLPLIKLYLKLMSVFSIYASQQIICCLFVCIFELFEIVRSHLFASSRKVFPKEASGLADSRSRTQCVKVTET